MAVIAQNRIACTLSDEQSIGRVREILEAGGFATRGDVAKAVCIEFGFLNWQGQLQLSSCLTTLSRLERQGHIELPASRRAVGWKRFPKGTGEALPSVTDVPEDAGEVSGLHLKLIENEAESRLWNEMLLQQHPQGNRIITGRQLRYLVCSEHGLLGALGVSSSALHLQARDQWIGWDWHTRQKYLERVICLSRFLIRTDVQCRNLASKVLGLFVRGVARDYEHRYGYRPWMIESFVDTELYLGTCYKAANWTRVGRSKGRGRYDSKNQCAGNPKDIYVYSLDAEFRTKMELPSDAGAIALRPAEGLDGEKWTQLEFGDAPLGDKRRSQRLVSIAKVMAQNSINPFIECARGKSALMQGYYRLIEHPDQNAVNMEAILEPHQQRTIKRMRNEDRILCAQDTTVLDFSTLLGCNGLGPTGANHSGPKGLGLRLHSTLALTTEGLPLGILHSECVARKYYGKNSKEKRRKLPFEQKEGYRWLESIKECEKAAEQLPQTRIVSVMDREADIFELFDYGRDHRKVHLLVRVARNRKSDVADTLFEEIYQSPLRQIVRIDLPKRRDRKRRLITPFADLEIRYKAVNLQVPMQKAHLETSPVPIWVVYAIEPNPPPNTAPIKWFLFSTEQIDSVERACQALREYSRRWRIEEWHKVLKSGCKIQDIIAEDAENIRRVVAINMVIAWRVLLMTMLGREQPDLPPSVLFSDIELMVLTHFAMEDGYAEPKCLGDATWLVAKLGGYLGRKSDLPPGCVTTWRGYCELQAGMKSVARFIKYDPG